MKINSIHIPKNFNDRGLNEINIDRLGDIVAIAGKNGAGKTRLLRIITEGQAYMGPKPYLHQMEEEKKQFEGLLEKEQNNSTQNIDVINKYKTAISERNSIIRDSLYIDLDGTDNEYIAVNFVPNNLSLDNSSIYSISHLQNMYRNAKSIHNISQLNHYALSYIRLICERYFEATHQGYADDPSSADFRDSFEALDELINTFLGSHIEINIDKEKGRNYKIFDRDIDNMGLSDGQCVLLQLCIMLHSIGASLDNMILLLDEPENHLHPAAQIEFIKAIMEALKHGQIWIATHSIHILSYYH